MIDLLLKNATVITMEEGAQPIRNAYLGISGRKITWIGENAPEEDSLTTIDCTNKAVLPGFINTHTHLAMSVFRGYADSYDLDTWLREHIWPAEAKLTREAVRAACALSVAEAVASGTVSVTDMYFYEPELAELLLEVGMMGNLSNGATCFTDTYVPSDSRAHREMIELTERYHGKDGLIKADASVHGEYTSNAQVWEVMAGYAKENCLNMHVHLSETRLEHEGCLSRHGMTPTALFAKHGLFDTRTTAAHCVHVTEEDMGILAAFDVTAAHDPGGNLKLASGIMNYPLMKQRGVRVALSTDSACAVNTNDMLFDIKLAAILHRGVHQDATLLPAFEVLRMATSAGAYAQGREHETGVLRVGYDADLIAIDLDKPHLLPSHSILSNIVYAARPSDVWMTMCKGRVLYRQGQWLTLDIERVMHDAVHVAQACIL